MPVVVYVLGPHRLDGSDGSLKRNVTRHVIEVPATATVHNLSEKLGMNFALYGPKGKLLASTVFLRCCSS
jgi:hypothetical protein